MTDLQRVSRPGSPFSGLERTIALVVTIGVLAAIVKPWGADSDGDRIGTIPAPSVRPASTPTPVALPGHAFDATMFGPFEPPPDWSIWPAGYFVSVRYVTRQAIDRPVAQPSPSSRPTGSPPSSSGVPEPSAEVDGPDWPAEIEVGPGDHLLWIGVNTPLGWTIRESVLTRFRGATVHERIPITRLPSEWDDHFAVLSIPVVGSSERLTAWPAGSYRLDITVDPGRITRSIWLSILTAPDPVPESLASGAP